MSCPYRIFTSASYLFLTLTLRSNAADAAGEAVNQAAAGEAVNQAAAGAGDIAQGTIQGAGGTVGQLPCVFPPSRIMKQR